MQILDHHAISHISILLCILIRTFYIFIGYITPIVSTTIPSCLLIPKPYLKFPQLSQYSCVSLQSQIKGPLNIFRSFSTPFPTLYIYLLPSKKQGKLSFFFLLVFLQLLIGLNIFSIIYSTFTILFVNYLTIFLAHFCVYIILHFCRSSLYSEKFIFCCIAFSPNLLFVLVTS